MRRSRILFALMALLAVTLLAAGCGDDDNPSNPGGGGSDQFDQTSAETMADANVQQAVMLADNINEIGQGVDTAKSGNYQWNPEEQRWEFHYQWDYQGFHYVWDLSVQYLDADGNPVQHRADATSAHHIMDGSGNYQTTNDGTTITWLGTYHWDVTVSGLHTGTYTATGGGTYSADYTVQGGAFNMSRHYVIDWEILDPGLVKPAGGCPTGTVRFTMAPYVLDVVFDGTDTANWSLKNAGGDVVDSGTRSLDCGSSS